MVRDWELEHPNDILPNSSHSLSAYIPSIQQKGLKKVWNLPALVGFLIFKDGDNLHLLIQFIQYSMHNIALKR
jgi:hypothetical protein